jgi:hypothetical protein
VSGIKDRTAFYRFSASHLLSHEHHRLPVIFFRPCKQAAKLVKPTTIFPDATPCNIVSRLSISEDSAIWAAFRPDKKVGTLGFPKREPFSNEPRIS